MMKTKIALLMMGLVSSGRAFAADGQSQTSTSQTTTTTTTQRKADGTGGKISIETKSKSNGAAGEVTSDEKLTLKKNVEPDGNTETTKDVKTSHKRQAAGSTYTTHVVEKTVRDAQGKVTEYEKTAK